MSISMQITKEMVGASGALALKSIRANQREADFVASTDAVDSHGEVIDQSSWVLNHYVANPVVLYAHDSRELPIGKATNVGVRSGRLEATIQFASAESNPMAEQVWRLVQEGMLRAVSVGFVPTDGRYEVRDGAEVFVWTSPVLKEISVVPVPANHEALSRMKSAFKTDNPASPPANNKGGDAAEETNMDLKDLQSKIEAQAKDLGKLENERNDAAALAAKAEDENRALKAQIKTLETERATERAAFEAQNKALAAERDAATAKVVEFEAKAIELEVESLVGVKITPADKDTFLELRKTNPDLFKKMIAQRAPLNLTAQITEKSGGDGALATTADEAMAEVEKLGKA
jgi:HK97 family phage prohead protease